jgi:hypothetical protein
VEKYEAITCNLALKGCWFVSDVYCATIKASCGEATRKATGLFLEAAGLPKVQRFIV